VAFGRRRHFRQILDRILSPTNFAHKHHRAISSPYAQIRAGEFGGRMKELVQIFRNSLSKSEQNDIFEGKNSLRGH
jgi:hypothetical protein